MDLNELTQNSIHDLNGKRYKVIVFLSEDDEVFIQLKASEDVNLSTE